MNASLYGVTSRTLYNVHLIEGLFGHLTGFTPISDNDLQ